MALFRAVLPEEGTLDLKGPSGQRQMEVPTSQGATKHPRSHKKTRTKSHLPVSGTQRPTGMAGAEDRGPDGEEHPGTQGEPRC